MVYMELPPRTPWPSAFPLKVGSDQPRAPVPYSRNSSLRATPLRTLKVCRWLTSEPSHVSRAAPICRAGSAFRHSLLVSRGRGSDLNVDVHSWKSRELLGAIRLRSRPTARGFRGWGQREGLGSMPGMPRGKLLPTLPSCLTSEHLTD